MPIEVRSAQPEELSAVNVIRFEVNRLHADGRPDMFKVDAWTLIEGQAAKFLAAEDCDVIVALADGAVAGFALVNFIRRPENPYMQERCFYHVEEFGVSADHRRMGIATALVDYMKQDAAARGFRRIELDMWEFNQSALAFYESAGFQTYRRYMELYTD